MRVALRALVAALLAACASPGARREAALREYVEAVRGGAAPAAGAEALAAAELAGAQTQDLRSAARAAAQQQHQLALGAADPAEAVAREELAFALLARGCPGCARERIPLLLHLAALHAQRGDARGLASCAARARALEPTGLDAAKLSDWPLLRQHSQLCERLGDFACATRIERSLLDAKLQILDAGHPQVAASRARIADLEQRAQALPPVGAAPADPPR